MSSLQAAGEVVSSCIYNIGDLQSNYWVGVSEPEVWLVDSLYALQAVVLTISGYLNSRYLGMQVYIGSYASSG